MADDRLAAFRAASEFAEMAASFVGMAYSFAVADCCQDIIAEKIGVIQSHWECHRDALHPYCDQLAAVAADVFEGPGGTYPSAHAAAIGVAYRLLSEITGQLLLEYAWRPDGTHLSSIRFDPSLIESHWPGVRKAILLFGMSDGSALASYVVRERGKMLEKMSPEADGRGKRPEEIAKKSKPKPETRKIIELLQKGRSIDQIGEALGESATNIRTVRYRLKNDKYEL